MADVVFIALIIISLFLVGFTVGVLVVVGISVRRSHDSEHSEKPVHGHHINDG
jgi:hypothetical protein